MSKNTVTMPWTPTELLALRAKRNSQWDEWYSRLPPELRHKLSVYDFKRLGDLFKEIFEIDPEI